MTVAAHCGGRVLTERGPLRYHSGRSGGDAAQLHRALGDVVHVIFHLLVDAVEQLVQRDEVQSLDVPVGLLGLRLEVDAVGQPRVEQATALARISSDRSILVLNRTTGS